MKIAIVTGHNKVAIPYVTTNVKIMADYAKENGYSFHPTIGEDFYFSKDEKRLPKKSYFFAKYAHVVKIIDDYDYVLWLDADVTVIGKDKIEDAFKVDKEFEFYIAPDLNSYFNAGVMLFQNTTRIRNFLDAICEDAFTNAPYNDYEVVNKVTGQDILDYDQGTIWKLYSDNFQDIMTVTRVLPANIVNAMPQRFYWGAPTDVRYDMCKDTFLMHQAGVNDEDRLKNILKVIKQ